MKKNNPPICPDCGHEEIWWAGNVNQYTCLSQKCLVEAMRQDNQEKLDKGETPDPIHVGIMEKVEKMSKEQFEKIYKTPGGMDGKR